MGQIDLFEGELHDPDKHLLAVRAGWLAGWLAAFGARVWSGSWCTNRLSGCSLVWVRLRRWLRPRAQIYYVLERLVANFDFPRWPSFCYILDMNQATEGPIQFDVPTEVRLHN